MGPGSPDIVVRWREPFSNDELNALHADCFDHPPDTKDWWSQVTTFSLGWVTARASVTLAGFVNLAWDGGVHCFVLETMVRRELQRQGLARRCVAEAVHRARSAGCEWLHVDFEPHLRRFYFEGCGFEPTEAGLLQLR